MDCSFPSIAAQNVTMIYCSCVITLINNRNYLYDSLQTQYNGTRGIKTDVLVPVQALCLISTTNKLQMRPEYLLHTLLDFRLRPSSSLSSFSNVLDLPNQHKNKRQTCRNKEHIDSILVFCWEIEHADHARIEESLR